MKSRIALPCDGIGEQDVVTGGIAADGSGITFVVSLLKPDVQIHEVHNNGAWYNLGFLLGVMASLGGGRADPSSYDSAYWRNQGWLAPGCTFYRAHRAGRVKAALARLAGAVLTLFMFT